MHICIDSSVFIRGIQSSDTAIASLFGLLDEGLILSIPRLVANEVTRNLGTVQQLQLFYQIFHQSEIAQ
jgi:hypothetical protein